MLNKKIHKTNRHKKRSPAIEETFQDDTVAL